MAAARLSRPNLAAASLGLYGYMRSSTLLPGASVRSPSDLQAISVRSPPSDLLRAISERSPSDLLRGISQKLACASALDTALSTLSNSSAIGASSCASLSACDETDETSHRRSEGFGGQSEAISGNQW